MRAARSRRRSARSATPCNRAIWPARKRRWRRCNSRCRRPRRITTTAAIITTATATILVRYDVDRHGDGPEHNLHLYRYQCARRDGLIRSGGAFPLTLASSARRFAPAICMFDTIILLTGPIEQVALAAVLRGQRPQLDVRGPLPIRPGSVRSAVLGRARLIGFVTPVVVPARILEGLGFGAYNFHPGPPQYPGWVPSHFAIYDRAPYFGVTAHVMTERVDAGRSSASTGSPCRPYFGAGSGAIGVGQAGAGVLGPGQGAGDARRAARRAAGPMGRAQDHAPPLQAMCEVPVGVSQDELDRRIKAFGAGHFGIDLTGHAAGSPVSVCRAGGGSSRHGGVTCNRSALNRRIWPTTSP